MATNLAPTCISCGAPMGSPHLPSCQFRVFLAACWAGLR